MSRVTFVENDKFTMREDSRSRLFLVEVKGTVDEYMLDHYIDCFEEYAKDAGRKGYTLVIDTSLQHLMARDLIDGLDEALQLYMDTGFRKVIMIMPVVERVKEDARQAFERVGFEGEVVDSMSELIM